MAEETYVRIESNARYVYLRWEEMVARLGPALELAMGESGAIIKRGIKENFQSQGAKFGEPWPALAAKTIANKAAKGTGGQASLVDSGRLEAHLTDDEGLRDSFSVQTLRIGATDRTVHFHQEGTKKMPRRVLIGVSAGDAGSIIKLFEEAVVRSLRGLL